MALAAMTLAGVLTAAFNFFDTMARIYEKRLEAMDEDQRRREAEIYLDRVGRALRVWGPIIDFFTRRRLVVVGASNLHKEVHRQIGPVPARYQQTPPSRRGSRRRQRLLDGNWRGHSGSALSQVGSHDAQPISVVISNGEREEGSLETVVPWLEGLADVRCG